MKSGTKRMIALTAAVSMVLPLAGCMDKNKPVIIENADSYAASLIDMSAKSLRKASVEDDDDFFADLSEDFDDWTSGDDGEVFEAIKDKITYEVDEDSYQLGKKKDEASIDVVFHVVDWESLEDDEDAYEDIDTYLDAIEGSEEMEDVTITFEFELDGDDWLVANFEEICDDFYGSFNGASAPVDYTAMVDRTTWYYTTSEDNGVIVYNNAEKIDLDIYLALGFEGSEVYYTVKYNGSVVYTSETSSSSREGYFRTSFDGATVTDDGHLAPGEYTITFFAENGTQIAEGTCTVTESDVTAGDLGDTSPALEVYDRARVERLKWYYADDRTNGITYSDTTYIDLDIWFKGSNSGMDCYYEVLYNGTKVYTSDTSSSSREGYFRTSYVGATTDANGNLAAGEYTIIFYDAQGTRLASDKCTVTGGAAAASTEPLTPDDVERVHWYFADSSDNDVIVYNSADTIDLDISFRNGRSGSAVYYTVEYNGTLVYTSPTEPGSYTGYFRSSYDGAVTNASGNLAAGEYKITFYSPENVELASSTCTVTEN
ncbi:MAG: hypothetical protein K6A80_07225 [Saccharofermentans sp.]|nr:hypothetical protein [Saccharofermentans sp.]